MPVSDSTKEKMQQEAQKISMEKEEQLKSLAKELAEGKSTLRQVRTELRESSQLLKREKAVTVKLEERFNDAKSEMEKELEDLRARAGDAVTKANPLGLDSGRKGDEEELRAKLAAKDAELSGMAAKLQSMASELAAATSAAEAATRRVEAKEKAMEAGRKDTESPVIATRHSLTTETPKGLSSAFAESLRTRFAEVEAKALSMQESEKALAMKESQLLFVSKHLLIRTEELQLVLRLHLTHKSLWSAQQRLLAAGAAPAGSLDGDKK